MFSRRVAIAATVAAAAAFSVPAFADMATMYSREALMSAQQSGKPVLVEISAPWCSTCKAQKAVLKELDGQERFKSFAKIEVDFDSQKDAVKSLGATMQSTLIVYKGKTEVGRLVGDAKKASIEGLLAKAL